MTTTVHKNLTGADLHEPKGADTALDGQVYVSNGAGSGVWTTASSVITNTAFTTGDLKLTHKQSADTSWILWSEGSIGDASSGATIRANADTASLFALYWNNTLNTTCAVSGGRGASAVADFAAHKTLTLPLGVGRVLGVAGTASGLTARPIFTAAGGETATLVTANLPAYTPSGTVATTLTGASQLAVSNGLVDNAFGGGGSTVVRVVSLSTPTAGSTFTGDAQGGVSTPVSIVQPTTFVNVMIKL